MAIRIANTSVAASAVNATLTSACEWVTVTNVGGLSKVYFRVDGTTAAAGVDENFALPAVAGAMKTVSVPRRPAGQNTTVSLIGSATATEVVVEAVDQ